MKIINKTIVLLFLVVVALTSCNNPISAPRTKPTEAMETALSSVRTAIVETQAAIPTTTPTIQPPTAILEREMQVYTDPEARYTITFPAEWKPTDKPNSFSGDDGFFETGYMPEMGYVSNAITVCTWLANIESKPEQSGINWMPPCSVSTKSDDGYSINYVIYESPRTDPAHRFIYVKTGRRSSIYSYINGGVEFSWLKFAYEEKFYPGIVPLNPEEAAFWENSIPMPFNISVAEYALPPEAQVGPTEEMLLSFVPKEAQPDWEAMRKNASTLPKEPTVEEQLKSLGYELKVIETQPKYRQQLLRDGKPLFDYVFNVPKVYKFSTDNGPITAFVVNTIDTRYSGYFDSFLVVNDTINVWDYAPADTANFAPILHQGELLWAKGTQDAGVEIRKNNRDVLFFFRTYFATHLEVDSFQAWNDHWILSASDFLIQDGEILNKKLEFQEIFEWSLVKDKPTYFFRKGSRVGVSHDGQVLSLQYQDIAHGLCCGFASNNPYMSDDVIRFFGKRDGVWYYVVVKFE